MIDVTDFGAVGDGVVDCADAVDAAAAAAGAGGHVHFPQGVYLVSRTVTLLANQTWSGPTMNMDAAGPRTILRSTAPGTMIECQAGTLTTLRLEGPGASVAGSVGVHIRASSVTLRDVAVRDVETGFSMLQVWYGHFDRIACYRVKVGVRVEYSYNVVFANLRVAADDGTGVPGTALELVDRSMVTLLGGAIEAYRDGIVVPGGAGLACYGTYFETKLGSDAVGVRMLGGPEGTLGRSNVVLSGCQVYLTHHRAWVDLTAPGVGESFTATGNKFKGGVAGVGSHAYLWDEHTVGVRMVVAADSWGDVVARGPVYRPDLDLPPGSVLMAPPSEPLAMFAPLPALEVSGDVAVGAAGTVATGHGDDRPTRLGLPVGAMFFDTQLKKPVWWDGDGWRDAEGKLSPDRRHDLGH
ncbi:glycosyl hydrolase family 28-related protein [Propionibacteriaceae bacterium G1746]|uniref:glycosyl hydrolase family 28-related protein n=1 Tax=Aestuariimicrobium sp. G57 TaxID=3418485 RepID=UPI003C21972C